MAKDIGGLKGEVGAGLVDPLTALTKSEPKAAGLRR
jgi:hypothetical protein